MNKNRKTSLRRENQKQSARKKRMIAALIILIIICVIIIVKLPETESVIQNTSFPREYSDLVESASDKYNIDEALIYAVIRTESHFSPSAVSSAGAIGLMQITEDTFFFVNSSDGRGDLSTSLLYDPSVNIDTGTYFLSRLINEYGDTYTALAAYNAGQSNVYSWLSDPEYSDDGKTLKDIPFSETKKYVDKVLTAYNMYNYIYYK